MLLEVFHLLIEILRRYEKRIKALCGVQNVNVYAYCTDTDSDTSLLRKNFDAEDMSSRKWQAFRDANGMYK